MPALHRRRLPVPLAANRALPPNPHPCPRVQAQQETAYVNMAKCEEEREKGNSAFKENRYPEAVAHYQEALKRCAAPGCAWQAAGVHAPLLL